MTGELEGAVALNGEDPRGFVGQENFIHKRLIRGAIGLVTGGPAGAAAGLLSGSGRRQPSAPPGVPGFDIVRGRSPGQRLQQLLPGGERGLEVRAVAGTRIACMSGFHANKSDYWLSSGEFVAKGSRCVRNRRRNPMNPRALSRAIGRVDAGKALQGKLAEITTAKWTSSGKRKE